VSLSQVQQNENNFELGQKGDSAEAFYFLME